MENDSDLPDGWSERPGGGLKPPSGEMAALRTIIGKQATGAIPNGRKVRKINSQPADATPDGTEGTVLGSVGSFPIYIGDDVIHFGYIIEWDNNLPAISGFDKSAVFITDTRIEEL